MIRERAYNGMPGLPVLLVLILADAALIWMLVMNSRHFRPNCMNRSGRCSWAGQVWAWWCVPRTENHCLSIPSEMSFKVTTSRTSSRDQKR